MEKDIIAAEVEYSKHAWQSLLAETPFNKQDFEIFFLELCTLVGEGGKIIDSAAILSSLKNANIEIDDFERIEKELYDLGLISVEVTNDEFVYEFDGRNSELEYRKATILQKNLNARRYKINPIYARYVDEKWQDSVSK